MRTKIISLVTLMIGLILVVSVTESQFARGALAGKMPGQGKAIEFTKFSQTQLKRLAQIEQSSNGQPLELLSQIGGAINNVYVEGDYAYVSEGEDGSWLRVVDISNPITPIPLGKTDVLGDTIWSLVVNEDYAYVKYSYTQNYSDTVTDLIIIDVSNPYAPLPIANMNLSYDITKMFLRDGFLFVLSTESLHIFDLNTPGDPIEVGVYLTAGSIYDDLFVYGNYAYISKGYDGLLIVDISDPTQPQFKATYSDPIEPIWIVKVEQNYAYVYAGGIKILDISDPINIVEIGYLSINCGPIERQGNYVYCLDAMQGITIIDVTDPTSMVVKGHYDLPGYTNEMALKGDYLYGADDGLGLRVLDVSDPNNPVEVAAYNPPGGDYFVGGYGATSGMAYRDGYIYSADFWSGVSIIDVHHPAAPVVVSTYDTPGDVRDIEIKGDYAYVAETFQGLRILNLQNPEQPEEVALVEMQWAWEVEVIGMYVFVRNPDSIEMMVDVSDPANPISVDVVSQETGVKPKSGNYLYPYFSGIGVHRMDMSDPLHPVDMGVLDAPYYYGGDFRLISDTIYITEIGGSGFQMVDISDPANPSILHIWDLGFSGWFAVRGNYLYVLNPASLAVLDISNLDNPILLATYQDFGLFPYINADDYQIIPVGNFIYAGIRMNGLAVFYYDVSTTKIFIPTLTR